MIWYGNPRERVKSLRSVDKKHRRAITKLLNRRAENNNEIENKIVISQYDLVLTQWAFIGVLLTHPRQIGYGNPTSESIQCFIHHMYHLGKDLGIEDEFNLCKGNIKEIIAYATEIEKLIIKPALESNLNHYNMSEHMLHGVSKIVPFIDPEAFKAWIYKLFQADTLFNTQRRNFASWKSTLLYLIQSFVLDYLFHYELSRRFFIPIFNALMRLGIYLANHYKYLIAEQPKMLNVTLFIKGVSDYIKKSI